MRLVASLLALTLAMPGRHAVSQQAAEPPFSTSGAFFALSVADLAASARWYREKLGLRVTMEPPRSGDAAVMILEGGGLIVELLQHNAARPSPEPRDGYKVHGIFKSGLVVDDFDRTIAALRARGVDIAYGPFPKSATQRANAIVRDHAGNLIQFFGK